MPATAKASQILTLIASAALSAYRGVSVAGGVPAAGATSQGFTQNAGAIGDAVPVVVLGTALAEAGAAIAAGVALELDAQGRVITRSSGVAVARMTQGSVAAAAGDVVEVFVIPN